MSKTLSLSVALLFAAASPSFAQAGRAASATPTKAASKPAENYWLSAGLTRLVYGAKAARERRQD